MAHGDFGYVHHGTNLQYCNTLAPNILLVGTALIDFLLALVTLYLFSYRLRIVLVESSSSQSQGRIRALLMKYTLLTVVSIISTVGMMVVVGVMHGAGFIMIDVLVNVMAIAFLSSYYNAPFNCFCGPGFQCVECCCNSCCEVKVAIDMDRMLSLRSGGPEGSRNSNAPGSLDQDTAAKETSAGDTQLHEVQSQSEKFPSQI